MLGNHARHWKTKVAFCKGLKHRPINNEKVAQAQSSDTGMIGSASLKEKRLTVFYHFGAKLFEQ